MLGGGERLQERVSLRPRNRTSQCGHCSMSGKTAAAHTANRIEALQFRLYMHKTPEIDKYTHSPHGSASGRGARSDGGWRRQGVFTCFLAGEAIRTRSPLMRGEASSAKKEGDWRGDGIKSCTWCVPRTQQPIAPLSDAPHFGPCVRSLYGPKHTQRTRPGVLSHLHTWAALALHSRVQGGSK